jgi:hypothetical protein
MVGPSLNEGPREPGMGANVFRTATDSLRPAQSVFADEGLPDRLIQTVSDYQNLHGMLKVRGSNPLSSTLAPPLAALSCTAGQRAVPISETGLLHVNAAANHSSTVELPRLVWAVAASPARCGPPR